MKVPGIKAGNKYLKKILFLVMPNFLKYSLTDNLTYTAKRW